MTPRTSQYTLDTTRLPLELARAFVELDADDSTREWIDAALARPRPRARMALRSLAMTVVSIYDANAWANVCQDRLLSTAQWRRLLGRGGKRLLDVGAGDGTVTRELAPLFGEIVTTELSRPMARRLRASGFTCHQRDLAFEPLDDAAGFDVVALQNVIDRTTHPLRLLDRCRQLLAKDGRLIVAVPVPIQPVAFIGPARSAPSELLPMAAPDFESAVAALHAQVFAPRGLRVAALTRAPYLCNGDPRASVHALDDAIFVLTQE